MILPPCALIPFESVGARGIWAAFFAVERVVPLLEALAANMCKLAALVLAGALVESVAILLATWSLSFAFGSPRGGTFGLPFALRTPRTCSGCC